MTSKKKTDRTEVIRNLQSIPVLSEDERPLVIMTGPVTLSEEEKAMLAASPWVAHSAHELCEAAIETFQEALGSNCPRAMLPLLGELQHKMEGTEYHLRRVGLQGASIWLEAEACLTQARATLEILARVIKTVLPSLPESFERDGHPLANALRNQLRSSRYHESCLALAEFIDGQDSFISELSAVRDAIHHRYGLPSLAKANTGTVHLRGLAVEEYCISTWLSLLPFAHEFLNWTVSIAFLKKQDGEERD